MPDCWHCPDPIGECVPVSRRPLLERLEHPIQVCGTLKHNETTLVRGAFILVVKTDTGLCVSSTLASPSHLGHHPIMSPRPVSPHTEGPGRTATASLHIHTWSAHSAAAGRGQGVCQGLGGQGLHRLLWPSAVAARLFRWWGKVGMSSGSQAVGRRILQGSREGGRASLQSEFSSTRGTDPSGGPFPKGLHTLHSPLHCTAPGAHPLRTEEPEGPGDSRSGFSLK